MPQATGAAPPGLGTLLDGDTPSQQRPCWQCVEQHWVSAAQLCELVPGLLFRQLWHALLPLQKSVPQHSWLASQPHPVRAQQDRSVAHWPLQQKSQSWFGAETGVTPVSKQPIAPQWPCWHVSPSQQSLSALQAARLAPQPQAPALQRRRVQQSASLVHAPLLPWHALHCWFWQVPTQQSPSAAHFPPPPAQRRQVPLRQARPSQHWLSLVQPRPTSRQVVAQRPNEQASPEQHGGSPAPQAVGESTHPGWQVPRPFASKTQAN